MLKEVEAAKDVLTKSGGSSALVGQLDSMLGPKAGGRGQHRRGDAPRDHRPARRLGGAVESSDGAPSPDELRGFATLSAALNAMAQRWNALRSQLSQ